MKKKQPKRLVPYIKRFFEALALAGAIVVIVGLYFMTVKAGIPYQDPPLDLQIRYSLYMETGGTLVWVGALTMAVGIAIRFAFWLADRKQRAL